MNAVIYQLVCTRFFRPFVVKYIKKLQEKRFHFTKNFAYILPQNGLKVSNFKGFLLISRHYLSIPNQEYQVQNTILDYYLKLRTKKSAYAP